MLALIKSQKYNENMFKVLHEFKSSAKDLIMNVFIVNIHNALRESSKLVSYLLDWNKSKVYINVIENGDGSN